MRTPWNVKVPRSLFYNTRTSKAVVCGGKLAVIKFAWRTRTRMPGRSPENRIGLPKRSKQFVLSDVLKRITVEKSRSVIVVKLWSFRLTSRILPMVTLSGIGLPMIRIRQALACGGMLLVISEEKEALIFIPSRSAEAGTGSPRVFRMMVRGPTTSLTVCSSLRFPSQPI